MNRNSMYAGLIFILLVFMLVGCNGFSKAVDHTATPTETIEPTETVTPTSTVTATPNPTAEATLNLTPSAPINFIPHDEYRDDKAGFAFNIPVDISGSIEFDIYTEDGFVALYPIDDTYLITLEVQEINQGAQLATAIENMKVNNPEIEFVIDENPVVIGDYEATRIFYYDETGGLIIYSEMDVVIYAQNWMMIVQAQSLGSPEEPRWQYIVKPMFDAVVDSLVLFEPVEEGGNGDCPTSTDPTYGYSEANPIRVGGDFLTGPSRERAYLDNLRGPNGEAIRYERTGSFEYGDTILDTYQITITGSSTVITLYLDEYSWSTPMAPVGLTCGGPFALSEP